MNGVHSGLVRWARRASIRQYTTVQNIFSSPFTISVHLSPSTIKLGRPSCRIACLLLCVSALGKSINHEVSVPKFSVAENLLKPTEI
jgi:hypothetical protein